MQLWQLPASYLVFSKNNFKNQSYQQHLTLLILYNKELHNIIYK